MDLPIVWQKMKIILEDCLVGKMNRFDALITTQKNPSTLQSLISEKILKKTPTMGVFVKKKMSFLEVFLDFFRNGTLQRAEFFLHCNQCMKNFI